MTLTKNDLIQAVHQHNERLTRPEALEAVESFLQLAKQCLASGDDLLLSGFGKFNVKEKRERRGRNPQTGDDLMLAPRRVVTFKPSGKLRELINAADNNKAG